MFKMRYGGVAAVLFLAACGGSGGGGSAVPAPVVADYAAVIQASVSGSSNIEIVDLAASNWVAVDGFYSDTRTDFGVQSRGEYFYRTGRLNIDTLTKVSIREPNQPEWQYSTKDEGAASANPQSLAFISDSEAFVIQYGSVQSLRVSLDPLDANSFVTGSIDLSAYDDGDGTPEAISGLVIGDRLYVLMQRLDRNDGWEPTNTAFIAVFDVEANSEIDLGIDPDLGGIPLLTRNPGGFQHVPGIGLVVHSIGSYSSFDYAGGIEVVNLDDYSTDIRVEQGGDVRKISRSIVLSASVGYFISYAGWGDTSVRRFNPATGEVTPGTLLNQSGIDVRTLALDPEDRLWIGIADNANPRVVVVDTETDSLIDEIPTLLNPIDIAFTATQ